MSNEAEVSATAGGAAEGTPEGSATSAPVVVERGPESLHGGATAQAPTGGLDEILRRLTDFESSIRREITELTNRTATEFKNVHERIHRSRETERRLDSTFRSTTTTSMPAPMPSDVKPAKMKTLDSTSTTEIRNWFRHARGYLKYYGVDPNEPRSVFWAAGHFDGPLQEWFHSMCVKSEDEVAGGMTSVTELEDRLITNFAGRRPAEQARLNLDKARQRRNVLRYANYFREQLLELPHRHEADNVHDFIKGLKPSIHREVKLKDPRTLNEAVETALRAEAAEQEAEYSNKNANRTARLNAMDDGDSDYSQEEPTDDSDEDSPQADLKAAEARIKLSSAEQKRRREGRLCYRCGQSGHVAKECKNKPRPGK